MMDQSEIAAAVREFEAAQARGEYFPRAWFDRLTLDDAYRILLALIRRRGGGSHRIGWKVGLTARAIQQQFGVRPRFRLFVGGRVGQIRPHLSARHIDRARL